MKSSVRFLFQKKAQSFYQTNLDVFPDRFYDSCNKVIGKWYKLDKYYKISHSGYSQDLIALYKKYGK